MMDSVRSYRYARHAGSHHSYITSWSQLAPYLAITEPFALVLHAVSLIYDAVIPVIVASNLFPFAIRVVASVVSLVVLLILNSH